MSTLKEFSESAKGFTKSPLGIIALFIVLVYGFASLVVTFGNNIADHVVPLIYFLIGFPIIVFFGFLWLVAKHYKKLFGPSDFKDEKIFLANQLSSVASLTAAISRQEGSAVSIDQNKINEIVQLVMNTEEKGYRKLEKTILWVDDRPENNAYERKAFEAQGLRVRIALSTDEALDLLERNKFSIIISDMGRKEGDKEGYLLLDEIKKRKITTPFIIYAGSNLPEHRRMAVQKGAIASTNKAQELYQIVMSTIYNN